MTLRPQTKVIVVDVLAMLRAAREKGGNVYDEDYAALQPLNAFAEQHRVSVLVVHHTRKAKADDPFDMISGSNAISGAVSAIWMLERVSSGKMNRSYTYVAVIFRGMKRLVCDGIRKPPAISTKGRRS